MALLVMHGVMHGLMHGLGATEEAVATGPRGPRGSGGGVVMSERHGGLYGCLGIDIGLLLLLKVLIGFLSSSNCSGLFLEGLFLMLWI